MKKLLPLLLATFVFVTALILMRPEAQETVLVAARDLPAGHMLVAPDIQERQAPKSLVPDGAIRDVSALLGQTLKAARSPGDAFYPANLGGEQIELAADERAIAVQVGDAAGLAGLLKPGDRVGVTAVIFGSGQNQGAYSKAISGGLRVLYVSPEFQALDPITYAPEEGSDSGGLNAPQSSNTNRKDEGVVVLAVPSAAQLLAYDFAPFGVESETRTIFLIDLLPALDHANNVELSLFLEPENASRAITSGLYLPNLVLTPGPSPTPSPTPVGGPAATPAPATPAAP